MPLSNIFSNRVNHLVDSFNDKDVINCHQSKNATSLQLSATRKNRVAGHFRIEEATAGRNRVPGHSGIEPRIDIANGDLSDVRFFIEE